MYKSDIEVIHDINQYTREHIDCFHKNPKAVQRIKNIIMHISITFKTLPPIVLVRPHRRIKWER